MPYNSTINQGLGSFKPISSFVDDSAEKARMVPDKRIVSQRVVSGNSRKLLEQIQGDTRLGDIAETILERDGLKISFDGNGIANPFLERLKSNGIKVKHDIISATLTIDPADVPKYLQGLLKMSDVQMQNFYQLATVPLPSQVQANQPSAPVRPAVFAQPAKVAPPVQPSKTTPAVPPRPTGAVLNQGGFQPVGQYRLDYSGLAHARDLPLLTDNIKSLVTTQMGRDSYDFLGSKLSADGLDLTFMNKELTELFLDKLKKNGIACVAGKNTRRTGPDIVDLVDKYTIRIASQDVPKFLQGILKAPATQMQYMYEISGVPLQPQVQASQISAPSQAGKAPPPVPPRPQVALGASGPTPITPALASLQTRSSIVSASNQSIADLHMGLLDQENNLGIKVKAGNIDGNRFTPAQNDLPGTFKAVEIKLGTKLNAAVCIAQEVPGGIDYTLGHNTSPAIRAEAIEKTCQLAVSQAKINTIFAFPANADEKATFLALNKALKQKYGEGYPNNPTLPPFTSKNEIPTIKNYDSLLRKYPPQPPEPEQSRRSTNR